MSVQDVAVCHVNHLKAAYMAALMNMARASTGLRVSRDNHVRGPFILDLGVADVGTSISLLQFRDGQKACTQGT